jgi:hypothetical protein
MDTAVPQHSQSTTVALSLPEDRGEPIPGSDHAASTSPEVQLEPGVVPAESIPYSGDSTPQTQPGTADQPKNNRETVPPGVWSSDSGYESDYRRQHSTWGRFNWQHRSLLQKRIDADQIRRKGRAKRTVLSAEVVAFKNLLRSSPNPPPEAFVLRAESLLKAIDDVEAIELAVEKAESDLVSAEDTLSRYLPTVPGFDDNRTFNFLMQSDLRFPTASSSSNSLVQADNEPIAELSDERRDVLAKLDEVNELEEQLMELRDDKSRLELWPDEDLGPSQYRFLDTFEEEKQRLKDTLRIKQSELDRLTELLQLSEGQEDTSPSIPPMADTDAGANTPLLEADLPQPPEA